MSHTSKPLFVQGNLFHPYSLGHLSKQIFSQKSISTSISFIQREGKTVDVHWLSFQRTLYKADEKMAEEELLKGGSGTRQREIIVQEGGEIECEKEGEKLMDLIFWMGELECI